MRLVPAGVRGYPFLWRRGKARVLRMSATDLVIFDCDGVLIDSELIGARVEAAELGRVGMPLAEAEILTRFLGMSAEAMYAALEAEHGRALPQGFAATVQAAIDAAFERDLQVIPGIHETLDRLPMASCVASSSTLARLRHSLGLTGLYARFAPHVFSAEQVARGKPAPDLFLHAAAAMGGAPARCLVIEDSSSGVRGAVAAGMRVWGFVGGGHCADGHAARLREAGAARVFDRMPDLPALLD
jgi:HAD superfamily hydrolase (TIGR01509 family)